MTTTIYYFSATGNSFEVAKNLSDRLEGARLESLVPLASIDNICCEGTVGLVFPVYDWNLPSVVREFLTRLDVSKIQYFFAVATCNYLPGCSLDTIKTILEEKKRKLNAGFVIRMPGTYLPMYGANSLRTQNRKFRAKNKKVDRIAQIVLNGQDTRIERSPVGIDRLFAPAMSRNMDQFSEKDRSFSVDPGCSGCGICAKVCPFGNIEIKSNRPDWLHRCSQCFACIHLCPKNCIQIGSGTRNKKRYQNPNVPLTEIIRIASEKYQYHSNDQEPIHS